MKKERLSQTLSTIARMHNEVLDECARPALRKGDQLTGVVSHDEAEPWIELSIPSQSCPPYFEWRNSTTTFRISLGEDKQLMRFGSVGVFEGAQFYPAGPCRKLQWLLEILAHSNVVHPDIHRNGNSLIYKGAVESHHPSPASQHV